ncbi:MAG TPA: hemolysin family protein [Polyangiaceae bacterium]|nr:hemolysin family protein [Polyangiaceae bacterium]
MLSLLISFFVLAICFSFLCSLWEAALLSITPGYAQAKLSEGASLGRHLSSFKTNIDRPLAAILTLNTISHTAGAIGVGEQATLIWSDTHPMITSVAVPVSMTLGILILSEIIPKTIGAVYWRELAPFTVSSLRVLLALFAPLVWLSQLLTNLLKKDASMTVFSRGDFLAMAELGEQEGVIERGESEIIRNLFRFRTIKSRHIMTPRMVVQTAPVEWSLATFHRQNPDLRFSRIPLSEGGEDHVVGYVLKNDVLAAIVDGRGEESLRSLLREILVVSDTFAIPELFRRFLSEREQIALVVDEFGGMAGIVTMEDVIETLLGMEILDESDAIEDMQLLARQIWEKRARDLGVISVAKRNDDTDKE